MSEKIRAVPDLQLFHIKILKQNEKYAIVDNYKSDELKKLGYTAEEIEDRKTIGLYDEILKNAK